MALVYEYFDKDTFVPEKNYFSTEKVKCYRHETEEELQLKEQAYKWSCIGFKCIGWGCLLGFIMLITFGILSGLYGAWYYFGAAVGAILFVGGIIFANAVCWPNENKYAEQKQEYRTENATKLWADATRELEIYNEEQRQLAAAWRAEHPFEEKIRACLLDPKSSVDVANLARYYAVEYLKAEKDNEQ